MRLSVVFGAVLATCTMRVVVGCSDSTSIVGGDAGENDAAPEASDEDASLDVADSAPTCTPASLPGSYGSKMCNECVAASCCAEVTACENDPLCKPLQRCLLDCLKDPDGGGCYAMCMSNHPSGKKTWDTVEKCWFSNTPGCLVPCT